jgi:hypothetical protein
MRWAVPIESIEIIRNASGFGLEKCRGGDHLKYIDVNGRIILKIKIKGLGTILDLYS